MKKNFKYALLGAIALTGTMGFTACSTDSDVAEDINPSYDAATGLVKSQFVLNIASNAQTRSGSTTVQAGGENCFRHCQANLRRPQFPSHSDWLLLYLQ